MKISFGITCMGRLHHLKETLPRNLKENAAIPDLEFVVLDYNSQDGMEEWAREALSTEIASGRVSYYKEKTFPYFHLAHAKNLACGLSSGDIVCNSDADTFISPDFTISLRNLFERRGRIIVQPVLTDCALCGRIALSRKEFHQLRGYDEQLKGYGVDDSDLLSRSVKSGIKEVVVFCPRDTAIHHPDSARTENMGITETSKECIQKNYEILGKRGNAVVNPEGWGRAVVYRNFDPVPIQAGWGMVGAPDAQRRGAR